MSSIKTTQIDGDISIGRNVTMGGKAEIAGSVQINHNIKIKGWLDAPNVATPMKGLFSSEERLKAAYNDLREGWYALVHTGNGQAACWVVEGGKWKNTGDTVAITQGASIADFMDEVNTAIEAEAKDRYQGDADLNAKILKEVADRKTADDAESAARITADNNLSTLINTEIADRVTDVEDLSNRIDAEVSARTEADANLSGRIDTEVTNRKTADTALDKDKEKRRKVYSFQLVDALTTSSTHADIQKAFTTHFNDDNLIGVGGTNTSIKDVIAIPGAGDRLIDVWNKLTIYLDDQQQRAVITSVRQYETETSGLVGRIKKYDITYSDGIVSKTITLDAQNADAWKITSVVTFDAFIALSDLYDTLQADISAEATARANADKALDERIDAEATTRANADNDLSKRIGAEATARANVDANLSNRIDAEVSAREAADNELVSRITDEMNVRSTAIQRLDNMLSEETQARITVDDNLAGLIDDTKSYLNIRIDEEAQTRLTEDNKKKNKDFVMRVSGETITTPEGVEFSLIDTEPQTLASVILHGECDIVLSDGIRNDYRLDHVWLSDGMPYGYKLLGQNQRLNIATVVEANSGNNKLVCKLNDDVRFDDLGEKPSINGKELVGGSNTAEQLDLCRKPIVLKPKVDENGERINLGDGAYLLEGATPTEIIQAMQLRRPLYLSFDGVAGLVSFTQLSAGLIPLTYRSWDIADESTFLFAFGNDGLADDSSSIAIGAYTVIGQYVDEQGVSTTDRTQYQIVCMEMFKSIYDNYKALSEKPQINGVELIDNKTSSELGLQSALTSGITIKTINGKNLLGAGNITIEDKTYIYCEVIGDKLFLRGKWKKLKDAGYVPYLFRRGRRHKLNKKNKATEDVTVLTKKGMHLYGRAEFISIIDDGLVRLINKEQTDIGSFDGRKTMIDYQVVYSLDPAGFINAHMSTSAEPASRGKLVVNNGRTEVVATYDENGNVQPIPKRFYWYIGFAAPRKYPTQTVRPSEVVSTFAKFFITQKPSLDIGYDYISDGWTFGA